MVFNMASKIATKHIYDNNYVTIHSNGNMLVSILRFKGANKTLRYSSIITLLRNIEIQHGLQMTANTRL